MVGGETGRLKAVVYGLVALLAIENAWLAYPVLRDLVVQPQESAEARGRRLAHELGCFNCHGPGGSGGVPNLGSKWDTVPSFHEGTPMMFVGDDQALREYILDGAPAAKRERPAYQKEMAAQAIHMPAFRGWLSDGDVEALVAYVRARSDLLVPLDEAVVRGGEIAHRAGCFACHGEMGGGGLPNPGSLKGYIPGFGGADFSELVRGEDELREWIAEGTIKRLRDDRLGSYFLERQRIQMPSYKRFLSAEEIDAVAAYVRWLAAGQWKAQPLGH